MNGWMNPITTFIYMSYKYIYFSKWPALILTFSSSLYPVPMLPQSNLFTYPIVQPLTPSHTCTRGPRSQITFFLKCFYINILKKKKKKESVIYTFLFIYHIIYHSFTTWNVVDHHRIIPPFHLSYIRLVFLLTLRLHLTHFCHKSCKAHKIVWESIYLSIYLSAMAFSEKKKKPFSHTPHIRHQNKIIFNSIQTQFCSKNKIPSHSDHRSLILIQSRAFPVHSVFLHHPPTYIPKPCCTPNLS